MVPERVQRMLQTAHEKCWMQSRALCLPPLWILKLALRRCSSSEGLFLLERSIRCAYAPIWHITRSVKVAQNVSKRLSPCVQGLIKLASPTALLEGKPEQMLLFKNYRTSGFSSRNKADTHLKGQAFLWSHVRNYVRRSRPFFRRI